MATAAAVGSPSDTECSVCNEFYTQPKLLPCAHLLCRNCLVTWMKSEKDALCPLCRAEIVDLKEKTGHKLEDIADSFPTDYSMVALVDATKLLSQPHVCKVCVDESASSLCLDCGDMLCCRCTVAHEKLSATSHHTVEELVSLTAERLAARLPVTCSAHRSRPAELFCHTHQSFVCMVCATTKHCSCKVFMKDLQDQVAEARDLLSKLETVLTDGEKKLTHSIDQMDQHLKDTRAKVETMLAEVEAVCNQLEKAIKACRLRLREQVIKASTAVENAVNSGRNVLLHRRSNLTSHKVKLHSIMVMTHDTDIEKMATSMESRIFELDFSVSFPCNAEAFSILMLNINPTQLAWLESYILQLGEVEKTPSILSADLSELNLESYEAEVHFHPNHGSNITLTNSLKTAERMTDEGNGIVLLNAPMVVDMLYEIIINKIDNNFRSHTVYLGVLPEIPDQTTLPAWCGDFKNAVFIRPGSICVLGVETQTDIGSELQKMKVGSRVGMALDASRCLSLYVDGQKVGSLAEKLGEPCYAMFDLFAHWKKVTVLPAKRLPVH